MASYTKFLCLLALACVVSSAFASIETEESFSRRTLKSKCGRCYDCHYRRCPKWCSWRCNTSSDASAGAEAIAKGRRGVAITGTETFTAPGVSTADSDSFSKVRRGGKAKAGADAVALGRITTADTYTKTVATPNFASSGSYSDATSSSGKGY